MRQAVGVVSHMLCAPVERVGGHYHAAAVVGVEVVDGSVAVEVTAVEVAVKRADSAEWRDAKYMVINVIAITIYSEYCSCHLYLHGEVVKKTPTKTCALIQEQELVYSLFPSDVSWDAFVESEALAVLKFVVENTFIFIYLYFSSFL